MNFFRELVSGQKVRFNNGEYNLDLTYITNRVIAMSFPASGFESTFRNNIDDVAKFLWEHHGDQYMLYNLSNRRYNYEKFEKRIEEFAWEDHHSPPIDMLFDVCKRINNVAIIHCQAGKGRTGTLICCYLLYSGRAPSPQEARLYYSMKRFKKAKSGVTQPSQIRYIYYFYDILKNPNYSPQLKIIDSITLVGQSPKFTSAKSCKPYVDMYTVKDKQKIYTGGKDTQLQDFTSKMNEFVIKIAGNVTIYGDILIKMYHYSVVGKKFMFRFAFNTCMIDNSNVLTFKLENLDPDSTVKDKRYHSDFFVKVNFLNVCETCINGQKFHEKCQECRAQMKDQEKSWVFIYEVMKNYPNYSVNDSRILLYGDPDYDDFDELVEKQCTLFQNNIKFLKENQQEQKQEESDDDSLSDVSADSEEEKKQQNEK